MQEEKAPVDFDEATYLACNPDVRHAVAIGQFATGFDHFIIFGRFENRRGAPSGSIASGDAGRHPPEHLRFRVHGGKDLEGYLRLGDIISSDLEKLLDSGVVTVPGDGNVLDFGSGPGRVITWFKRKHKDWKFFGTDIDDEAIGWARANLGDLAEFECNSPLPPLRFGDGFFDFVYSISIFTHLPEDMQSAWLQELARVTRAGGCLVLTTHGMNLLSPQIAVPESGFYYSVGSGTDGLPGFYQTSFQTTEYVRRVWSRYFSVEKIIPAGLANLQDLVVCRKLNT